MIPSLADRCRSYLEANINAENVLDLLSVVEKMEEIYLTDVCWKVIDTSTAQVLESAPDVILEDNTRLLSILKRDTLDVKEVKVFQAVNRWAENICAKRGKTLSGKEKRAIIGEEVVKLIRFPVMTQGEFAEHVAETKILTEPEIIEIFMQFSLSRNPEKFSCIPRCLNSENLLRCKRVQKDLWQEYCKSSPHYEEFTESISFSVNVPIVLGGISISGYPREKYTVKLKLNYEVVSEGCFLSEKTGGLEGFDIIFEQYHLMNPDIPCILEASIKGPRRIYGSQTQKELVSEKVHFRFSGQPLQRTNVCIVNILYRHLKNK